MFSVDEFIDAKRRGDRYAGIQAAPRTLERYSQALKQAERLVGKPLCEFDEESSELLTRAFDRQSYSQATRAQMIAALKGAFSWAIKTRRFSGDNPFDGIVVSKAKRSMPIIFSEHDLGKLFEQIEHPKYRLFFKLMYYCGLRINEVRTLRKDALRVTNAGTNVLLIRGKGDVERFVPVPPFVAESIRAFSAKRPFGEYLFINEQYKYPVDEPMSAGHAYQVFNKVKRELGLPATCRPHNLRHTAATHLYEKTTDLPVVQEFLRHENIATTRIYAQVSQERLAKAALATFSDL